MKIPKFKSKTGIQTKEKCNWPLRTAYATRNSKSEKQYEVP